MPLPTTQIFQQVETLLRDKRFSEALQLLKNLDLSGVTGEEYGYYCILLTEAGLNVGKYFESYVDEAIEIFRFSSDAGKFAKAKYLKGWLFSSLGRHHEAKELFIEAYTNYLRGNDLNNAARVLNRLTFVTIHTGNIETAIDNLRKCIEIYGKLGESVIKRKVAHNLAYLYFMCGNLRDSLSTYNAYPVTEQEHGEKPVMNFFNMSAIPHALKGDLATAKKTVAKAIPYLEKYPRDKAIYYENLGLILILDGDYAGAEKALKEGLRISLEIAPESALVSQIKRLFGDLYIAMSNAGLDSRLHGNDKEPRNDKDTSFLRRQETSKPSFLRRQETSKPSFLRRQESRDASFLRRQETSDKSFLRRQETSKPSFLRRQETSKPSFLRRQESRDASFLRRQETSDKSFLRRQESSIALAEKYASEALAVAEKINERVEIAAYYRIFAQVEQHRGTPITSGGAPRQCETRQHVTSQMSGFLSR
jgi:tetratricopeptide (TPR) repeat protein